MYTADLHMHSHFANATSPQLTLPLIAHMAGLKGVDVLGTGDFTHPVWLEDIRKNLHYDNNLELYRGYDMQFLLTTEVSLIYIDENKARKIHYIILAPNIAIVEEINKKLSLYGNLAVDGRPVLQMSSEALILLIHEISKECEVIPAHIWTPWFGCMGQRFGYTNLEDCCKKGRKYIHAIETGLSSDPYMNWLVFDTDISIVSFSDAHSLDKIGRELTAFEGKLSYSEIIANIRKNNIAYTVEFFPEEGKYHYAGHRKCNYVATPEVYIGNRGICPICKRKLTPGVLSRVLDIALMYHGAAYVKDIRNEMSIQENGFFSIPGRNSFIHLIQLKEIIAHVLKVKSTNTKKVARVYETLVPQYGKEIDILMHPSQALKNDYPDIVSIIKKIHANGIKLEPGYDNTYGKVIFG